MNPEPKFQVGSLVWVAHWGCVEHRVPCPDCGGGKTWDVTTPTGEEFRVGCTTCRNGWEVRGFLTRYRYEPRVYQTKVGAVRVDTHDDRPVSYMVEATGVGTGRIWYEEDLFLTINEAEARAKEKVAEAVELQERSNADVRERRRREARPRDRWERHRDGLIKAVKTLVEQATETMTPGYAFDDQLLSRIDRYVGWIKGDKR